MNLLTGHELQHRKYLVGRCDADNMLEEPLTSAAQDRTAPSSPRHAGFLRTSSQLSVTSFTLAAARLAWQRRKWKCQSEEEEICPFLKGQKCRQALFLACGLEDSEVL